MPVDQRTLYTGHPSGDLVLCCCRPDGCAGFCIRNDGKDVVFLSDFFDDGYLIADTEFGSGEKM